MSFRRLKILIGQLPVESATMTELAKNAPPADPSRPVNHGRWSRVMFMLADLIDAEHGAAWQRAGDPNAARPEPVSRPGTDKPVSPSRRRYLDKVRANGGAAPTR